MLIEMHTTNKSLRYVKFWCLIYESLEWEYEHLALSVKVKVSQQNILFLSYNRVLARCISRLISFAFAKSCNGRQENGLQNEKILPTPELDHITPPPPAY